MVGVAVCYHSFVVFPSSPRVQKQGGQISVSVSAWDKCSFWFGMAWDFTFYLNRNIIPIANTNLGILNLDFKQNRIFLRLAC